MPALFDLKKLVMIALAVILTVTPFYLYSDFIKAYSTNVIYLDQWDYIPLFEKLDQGRLAVADLFEQSNEHRPLLPKAVMVTMGYFTGYNVLFEIWGNVALLFGSCVLLLLLFRPDLKDPKSHIVLAPALWAMLSLNQWESALWGICMVWYMAMFFFFLTLYFLVRAEGLNRYFWLSVISAAATNLSCATGVLVWPMGLALLVSHAYSKERKFLSGPAIIWCVAAAVMYLIYLSGLKTPGRPFMVNLGSGLIDNLKYLFAFYGGYFYRPKLAVIIGAGLFISYITVCAVWLKDLFTSKNDNRKSDPYFALILVVLLCGLFLVTVRGGIGWKMALSSRYVTVSVFGIIGLYLWSLTYLSGWKKNLAVTVLLLVIASGYIMGYSYGSGRGEAIKANRNLGRYYILSQGEKRDEDLIYLYEYPGYVRSKTPFLGSKKMNMFSIENPGPSASLALLPGNADLGIYNTLKARKDGGSDLIVIFGWALDPVSKGPSGGVIATLNGQYETPSVANDLYSPDIAKASGVRSQKFSTFAVEIDGALLKKGRNEVTFKVLSGNRKGYHGAENGLIFDI